MEHVDSESPSDVARWLRSESTSLWPALLGSLSLRRSRCIRKNCAPVPKHDAFQRGFIRLTPQTLRAVNDLVVRAAVELGLEDGAKLRVDTTVVQTDIHHPTD